ncbi:MAG: CDGSH iron-sulfur domain-containing protein [Bacteroidales bacterium]|jgi:CDGSH-type Zn-finger protein|nr:CDGSH iron-sulfur domain-containing protein [Bacteroidales bacterium]
MKEAKGPIAVEIKKGEKKAWCSCGLSAKQPFCDGSHQKTDFKPLIFEEEADTKVYLCTCKKTKNPPYCDGSHSK